MAAGGAGAGAPAPVAADPVAVRTPLKRSAQIRDAIRANKTRYAIFDYALLAEPLIESEESSTFEGISLAAITGKALMEMLGYYLIDGFFYRKVHGEVVKYEHVRRGAAITVLAAYREQKGDTAMVLRRVNRADRVFTSGNRSLPAAGVLATEGINKVVEASNCSTLDMIPALEGPPPDVHLERVDETYRGDVTAWVLALEGAYELSRAQICATMKGAIPETRDTALNILMVSFMNTFVKRTREMLRAEGYNENQRGRVSFLQEIMAPGGNTLRTRWHEAGTHADSWAIWIQIRNLIEEKAGPENLLLAMARPLAKNTSKDTDIAASIDLKKLLTANFERAAKRYFERVHPTCKGPETEDAVLDDDGEPVRVELKPTPEILGEVREFFLTQARGDIGFHNKQFIDLCRRNHIVRLKEWHEYVQLRPEEFVRNESEVKAARAEKMRNFKQPPAASSGFRPAKPCPRCDGVHEGGLPACKMKPWDKINKTMKVPGGPLRPSDYLQMVREGQLTADRPYDMSKCSRAERNAVLTAIRRHRNIHDRDDRAAGGAGAGHAADKRADNRNPGEGGKKWEPRDKDRGARKPWQPRDDRKPWQSRDDRKPWTPRDERKPWPPRDERKRRNDHDDHGKGRRDERGQRSASEVVTISTAEYEALKTRGRPSPDEAESSSDSDVDRVAQRRRA